MWLNRKHFICIQFEFEHCPASSAQVATQGIYREKNIASWTTAYFSKHLGRCEGKQVSFSGHHLAFMCENALCNHPCVSPFKFWVSIYKVEGFKPDSSSFSRRKLLFLLQ